MQLHLGEMSNQEMADWFDTSLKNFYNKKAKKLEELKDFADFHEERGKIIIDEIRIPTYEKHTRKNYNKVKDHFDEVWSETGLDTCAHASEQMQDKFFNEDQISLSTIYTYTRESRNELYGKPFQAPGTMGYCEYTWCKYDDETDSYYQLNEDELALKRLYVEKYFGRVEDKMLFARQMVLNGEITKEQYFDFEGDITGLNDAEKFKNFLEDFSKAIGARVVHATLVYRNGKDALPGAF